MDELTGLLHAAQHGDEVCVAAWIRRTQAEVWRLCAHLVDRQSADDLTQETYVRAWKALPAFRGDASARTWLLSIARRTCADALRVRARRRRLLDAIVQRAVTTPMPDQAEHVTLTAVIAGARSRPSCRLRADADHRPQLRRCGAGVRLPGRHDPQPGRTCAGRSARGAGRRR